MLCGKAFNHDREQRENSRHVAGEPGYSVAVKGQGQAGKTAATVAGLCGPKQSRSAAMVAETEQGTGDLRNDKKSDEAH